MSTNRKASTSITELTKTVAREVVLKVIEEHDFVKSIGNLQHRMRDLENDGGVIDCKDFLENIQSNLESAGLPWSLDEDKLLNAELETAFRTIAKNHNRSLGAITSKVEKEGLIPQVY